MSITCLGIVGSQNNPLYIRTFPDVQGDALLQYHFTIHCALDAVEEKLLQKRPPGDHMDTFLGLLYPTDDCKVYGYITNTNTKLIALVSDSTPPNYKDESIAKVLRKIHHIYVDFCTNPFFSFGIPIQSAKFDNLVRQAVASYGKTALPSAI